MQHANQVEAALQRRHDDLLNELAYLATHPALAAKDLGSAQAVAIRRVAVTQMILEVRRQLGTWAMPVELEDIRELVHGR